MNKENQKVGDRRLLAELARERVVTTRQLARRMSADKTHAVRLARSLQARGLLKKVKRGVYAVVPLEADPTRFQPDPVLVAHAALGQEYAFSHFTALQLLGAEHHAHKVVHVSKPGVRSRRMRVGDVTVHVHGVSAKLWEAAVTRVKRGRTDLMVTTPERTLVDLVALPPGKQDYEEVVHAYLDLKPKMRMHNLVAETLVWGNNTTLARMGHLIAHHGRRENDDPFQGKMGDFVALKSPYYFGTRPKDPANKLDKTFNVVYPEKS